MLAQSSCIVNRGRLGEGKRAKNSLSFRVLAERPRVDELKKEIRDQIQSMGLASALLPGSPVEKGRVTRLVESLVEHTASPAISSESISGSWDLVFTSNGTVVTRTPIIQAVSIASRLPGTGIKRISQRLEEGEEGSLKVLNQAVIGFGPFGEWRLGILGEWSPVPDESPTSVSHLVKFAGLAAKPTGILGIELPDLIPEISLGLPEASRGSGAVWVTTYCDSDIRVGRGSSSGNSFVFFKSIVKRGL